MMIVAGLAVLTVFTCLGTYVVAAWLSLIAVNLVLAGHFDIAVRDLVMAIGAYTLGEVAALRGAKWFSAASCFQAPADAAEAGTLPAPAK
jgi:hypothetical protein